MNSNEIINSILNLLAEKNNEFDGNIYSFRYSGNIKNEADVDLICLNPSISLTGYETIKKYNDLYNQLYKQIVGNKHISLKSFKDTSQNLIFENNFDVSHLKDLVSNYKEFEVFNVRKIYGLTMTKNQIQYGKYKFVRKDYLKDFIFNNSDIQMTKFNDLFFGKIESDALQEEDFVYLIASYITNDNIFAKNKMDQDLILIINAIRFMSFIKHKRINIDYKPIKTFRIDNYQYTKDGKISSDMHIERKDLSVPIDDTYFSNGSNGSLKIWNILSCDNQNEFEQRIMQSINWIGMSLNDWDDISVVSEIAFAFESLLYNNDEAFVSKGVVASLSESYAFINGITIEERMNCEKEFKEFYKCRSAISHGTRILKKESFNVGLYYNMIQKTIIKLLTDEEYAKCTSCNNLYSIIQNKRYQ